MGTGGQHLEGGRETQRQRAVAEIGLAARPDEALNKRDVSTGENGEFGAEVVFGGLRARFAGALRLILRRGAETATHAECCGYGCSLQAG